MAVFEDEYHIIAQHITECTQLTEEEKQQFFDEINGDGNKSKDELTLHAENYFRSRKMIGEEFRERESLSSLGHLHSWTALEVNSDVNEILGEAHMSFFSIRESYMTGSKDKLVEMLECLEDIPLKYVVWGFYNGLHPFGGVDMERLPCILALNSTDLHDYFPFEISVPADAAVHEATAFDAGMFDLWCPGGYTCPLHECDNENGLREAIMPGTGLNEAWVSFNYASFPELN